MKMPDARLPFSIVLLLTATRADRVLLLQQDEQGRALGMTRLDITLARQGLSFDYRIGKALALALACRAGSSLQQRDDALRAGIDAPTCALIERLAAEADPTSPIEGKKNTT